MMKSLRWSRWGLLSMCCAASTLAAEGENPAELFEKLDANKDGQVTVEEIPEEHRPHFERLLRKGNTDDNQTLSKDEWAAAHTPDAEPEPGLPPGGPGGRDGRGNPGQFFERLDANKDGKFSKNEIPAEAPEPFRDMLNKAFEKAGQDELSREDLMKAFGESMRGRGGPPDGGRGAAEMLERLKALDKNGDGKVSMDEVPEERRDRIKGLMEQLGGGDSIDLKKAEEFAARMGRPGEGRPGEGRRPDGEGRPDGDRPRPEGRDGDRPRPEGDRGPEGRRPGGEGRPDGDRARPEDGGPPRRDGDRGPGDRGPEGRGPHGGLLPLLDENRDGRLSRDEFSKAATYFSDLDLNRDGSLDPMELMGPPPRGFDGEREMGPEGRGPRPDGERRPGGDRGPGGERMRDGDRPGPRGEGDGARPEGGAGGPGRPPFGGNRPDGAPGAGGPGGPGGRFNPEEFWKQLDKDGDGGVSKEEAPDRMKENFDEIDADKNGKITQEEARASMERRFGGGRGPGAGGPGRGGPPGGPGRADGERPARPAADGPKPEGEKPAEKPAE